MAAAAPPPAPKHSLRVGVASGLTALALVLLALLPARLLVALRVRGGSGFERATAALAGAALDFSVVALPIALVLLVVGALVAWTPLRRRALAHHLGAPLAVVPLCVLLYLLTLVVQEVKAERGAFPTLHEITTVSGEGSFLEGMLGFIRYQRVWLPALACTSLAVLLVARRWRAAQHPARSMRAWALGLGAAGLAAVLLAPGAVRAQSALTSRLSAAGLGDPLTSLAETTFAVLRGRPLARPMDLLLELQPTPASVAMGAERLGWPPAPSAEEGCWPLKHARRLDAPGPRPPRAGALLRALEDVSRALFDDDGRVAVFLVSLESFRADDLHALHAAAPEALHPFVNNLYARAGHGVLASRRAYQAGVRTAQGLAAMTCGLGTLPYNLSLIRDVEGFPLRCATDVLADAGFHGAFFYGSEASYDGMSPFLARHGLPEVVSQDALPPRLPKGARGGVTDFALFDEAARRVAENVQRAPQLALVMSLSNHSPYTTPEDLPPAVTARVDQGLASAQHRATADDRRRLLTHSYTDAALERFFGRLDALGVAERALVVLLADHSTGDDYVWGPPDVDHETDAAKAQVPFLVVVPPAFLARVKDPDALAAALAAAQARLDETPLSQNDVPALLLALLAAHPGVRALPPSARWHTLGGQATSPWFHAGGEVTTALFGINGVDQLYALDEHGARVGPYEDVVFLRTHADLEQVTPRLIPVGATLVDVLRSPRRLREIAVTASVAACPAAGAAARARACGRRAAGWA